MSSTSDNTKRGIVALQVVYGALFIIGILENILVFHEINKKKTHRRLTTNQLLMLHLTVVDMLVLMTLTPAIFYMKADVTYTSFMACYVLFPMVLFYPYVRAFTQVVIAIERRRAVVTPFKPRFQTAAVVSMLCPCWLLPAVLTSPVIWVATISPQSCGNGKPESLHRAVFYTLKTFLQFVVPVIIISACYVQAGLALRRSRYRIYKASQWNSNALQHEASRLHNIRVCKAFAIMVVVFAVCTAPLNAMCLWLVHGSGKYEAFENQALYCFVSNFPTLFMSFLDPIIYGTFCIRRHGRSRLKKAWDKLVSWKNKALSQITCSSK